MNSMWQDGMLALSNDFLLKGTNLPAILPPALAPLYQEWEAWSWVGSRMWPPTSSSDRTVTRTRHLPASGPRVVSGARGFPVRTGGREKIQRQMSWGSENQNLPLPYLDRCCVFCMSKGNDFVCVDNCICFRWCLIQVFSIHVVLLCLMKFYVYVLIDNTCRLFKICVNASYVDVISMLNEEIQDFHVLVFFFSLTCCCWHISKIYKQDNTNVFGKHICDGDAFVCFRWF